jgi:hypothetical protein
MDQIMNLFLELVRELVAAGDNVRLEFLKRQFEADRERIGSEARLMEKYEIVCDALLLLQNMN